jgi:predicted AlkP superfamily pyrophosphatase or phosphodiesterase
VTRRGLILVVIDGLTPSALEAGIDAGALPTLAALAEQGTLGTAVSVFPSLTPVCVSSIATGAYPSTHEIPHIVWWHRGERRIVEYGSSFGALRAAGVTRSLRDTLLGMNSRHLGAGAVTLFEALADAGLVTAAVNFTAYRGRTTHQASIPLLGAVRGPERFFYYNLFESQRTGAPLSWRSRSSGTVDGYAAAVGRWLVTRDAFDFLVYYLSDYDYASHALGPAGAGDVLVRRDAAVASLAAAAGGIDDLLARYEIVVVADHGQTAVSEVIDVRTAFGGVPGTVVTASNRAAMVYRRDGCLLDARELAARLDGWVGADIVLFREEKEAIARKDGEELRFAPAADGTFATAGDETLLDHPDALARAWGALANPNAGEVLVSATVGFEFSDLGGRHHCGGGSHGSLGAGDSVVPVLVTGRTAPPSRIVDIAPYVLDHFGVAPPAYALGRAA